MGLLRGFMGGLWRCGALEIELSTELREIMEGPFALVECACLLSTVFSRFLSVKALVGAFNKEMAQVGAFSESSDISRSPVASSIPRALQSGNPRYKPQSASSQSAVPQIR